MTQNTLYLGREWNVNHDRRVEVKDAELRYTVIGEGEPVVCIHGTSIADSLITPLRFYPAADGELPAHQLLPRGLQRQHPEEGRAQHRRGAEHVKQLLDHLGIEKAHIMAFSFGGVIAFQFLLSYPERVHSAILLEPYLPREEPDAIQANIDAYMGAMELYNAGDKLGAAQRYMEVGVRAELPRPPWR